MSEGSSAGKMIAIGCGVLSLVGLCCVGGGGFAFYSYREKQEEQAMGFIAEMEAAQAREQAEAEALAEQDRQRAEVAAMIEPPPPLVAIPRRTRERNTRHITATINRAEGASGLTVGQECSFDVTVHDRENAVGYWCRALVDCAGVRLYGQDFPDGRGNGYFECAITRRPLGVTGEDRDTTAEGSDPFLQIDTRTGRLVVIDDAQSQMVTGAFRIEASITAVE